MLRILFLLKVELHDGISCMLGVYEKAKKFDQKKNAICDGTIHDGI